MSAPLLEYAPPTSSRSSVAMLWVNLALSIVSGAVAGWLTIFASTGHEIDGFVFWAFSPFVALGCIAIFFRHDRAGSATIVVAAVLMAGLLGLEVHDYFTSTSSTAALVFLIIPVCQWGVFALAGGIIFSSGIFRRIGSKNIRARHEPN